MGPDVPPRPALHNLYLSNNATSPVTAGLLPVEEPLFTTKRYLSVDADPY